MPIYKVAPAKADHDATNPPKPRLIRAERRAQVESYLIGEVLIEKADADEAHALGKQGVEVESAT